MAMAEKLAESGKRTLLVELGDHSYFSFALGFDAHYEPQALGGNLFHSLWSGETCLREYIRHIVPVKQIADLFFDNKVMRSFIRAAPGLKELAILGKLTSGIRNWGPQMNFDCIVLDAYSTGHLMALLKAPKGMAELIEAGPMGTQSRAIVEVLNNSKYTKYHVVTLPEELPVSEGLELRSDIQDLTGLKPELICNRLYEFPKELRNSLEQAKIDQGPEGFIGYLENLRSKQSLAMEQLLKSGAVSTLPFVLKADVRSVIDELKDQVVLQWQ